MTAPPTLTVRVNGTERTVPAGARVADAVELAGAAPAGRGVAVAVDGEVVPRRMWEGTTLHEGARVEVVQAIQGG